MSKCLGNGLCNNTPLILLSLFNSSIKANNSSIVVFSGSKCSSYSIPISLQALFLFLTYIFDAGSSPTKMTANFGLIPSFLTHLHLF